jgi:hypothetical protein
MRFARAVCRVAGDRVRGWFVIGVGGWFVVRDRGWVNGYGFGCHVTI